MATVRINDGNTILYTASTSSDVSAGDVIIQGGTATNVVGIAPYFIAKGTTGVLETTGCFYIDCGSATTFSVGASVYFNQSSKLATATNTDYLIGKAFKACVSGDKKVAVKIG